MKVSLQSAALGEKYDETMRALGEERSRRTIFILPRLPPSLTNQA